MPHEARRASPDELLADAAWLRRLASALVSGSHDPDDLAQDVWVAALRRPPRADAERPLRAWLSEVLRNAARMRARGGRRRLARDGAFAAVAPDEAPSPEHLLERLHAQRLVAELVAGLAEPYRSTLLLHYYEGMSSADVARLQGVPAGTVRWRLKTGLDQLRAGLDRESPGGRRLWLVALFPLADRAALGPAGLLKPALKGALIVSQTSKIAAVATLVVASGSAAFLARRPSPSNEVSVAAPSPAAAPEAPAQATDARRLRDVMREEIIAALQKREAEAARSKAPPGHAPAALAAATTAVAPAPALAAAAAPASSDPDKEALPLGHYETSYIQEVFREAMFPLLSQCYDNALAQRPKLAGTFVLSFAIVADPDVGGVVDEAEFDPESDLKDPEMEACARESLLTLTFDKPPRGGGRVTVKYPVAFAPGDDAAGSEREAGTPAR